MDCELSPARLQPARRKRFTSPTSTRTPSAHDLGMQIFRAEGAVGLMQTTGALWREIHHAVASVLPCYTLLATRACPLDTTASRYKYQTWCTPLPCTINSEQEVRATACGEHSAEERIKQTEHIRSKRRGWGNAPTILRPASFRFNHSRCSATITSFHIAPIHPTSYRSLLLRYPF